MEDLLSVKDEELTINPQALMIEELRTIWKRDPGSSQHNPFTKKNERVKHRARRELSYVWFMENWKSPYQTYTVVENRMEMVKRKLGFEEDWQEDAALKAAREWYSHDQEETNPFIFTLKAAKKSMVELGMFLNQVTLIGANNRDQRGGAIFKPKDITGGIKELSIAQESLMKMEEAVKKNQVLNRKVRGGGDTGMYED